MDSPSRDSQGESPSWRAEASVEVLVQRWGWKALRGGAEWVMVHDGGTALCSRRAIGRLQAHGESRDRAPPCWPCQ